VAHPPHQRRDGLRLHPVQLQPQFVPPGRRRDLQQAGARGRSDHTLVAVGVDPFDAGNHPPAQERQHQTEIQRWPVAQPKHQPGGRSGGGRALPADRAGGHATAGGEGIVEAAQAVEAGGQGDVRHRQLCFGEQLPGLQQPVGGMQLHRGGTQPGHEQPLQLAWAQAHPCGERAGRVILQEAGMEQLQGAAQHILAGGLLGLGGELGPAAQAGAEPGRGGRSGAGVIGDVARFRGWRRADRSAIDAGAVHGGEEHAVKTRIARQAGAFAGGGVGRGGFHGSSLGWRADAYSPFPDANAATAARFRRGCRGCLRRL